MSVASLLRMRTTVRLDDDLLRRIKALAAQRGSTLTAVLQEALREWLSRQRRGARREPTELPVSDRSGGLRPGVDLDDAAGLLERMEEDAPA